MLDMSLIDQVGASPLSYLEGWIAEAGRQGVKEPNAMALATATPAGRPTVRIVLCKSIDAAGQGVLVFYTNYESRKAAELDANPWAAAVFHWQELGRQARVEGIVTRTSRPESEAYFATRPRGSQLGAWASPQSQPLAGYGELVQAFAREDASRRSGSVPCPPHWGGYRLAVSACELWVGHDSRLHDRVRFTWDGGGWARQQLAP
jgi:pyridoxamine 5'-phosphate oxidase